MIVSKIRGGLGNQLFIYAAGRRLAAAHKAPLLLDISWYRCGARPFLLDQFNICADITTSDHSHAEDGIGYNQQQWCYYDGFEEYSADRFLSGWWQSERFFEPAADLIRSEFVLREPAASETARAWMQGLRRKCNGPVVAVHRRRRDYVELARQRKFRLLGDAYYQAAMERFPANSTFLVLSDDPQWCRAHMQLPRVEFCDIEDTLVSFTLMQLCDHYIISNSTFSWWAAWLGESPGTQVVAPAASDWFGPVLAAQYETHDIIPARWIQLPPAGG
jgi:Glycosyl transferase family 11